MSNEYQVNAHLSKEDADEFIKENPYNFSEEEINVTKDFKKHVKSNFLMIVGFDKDYTKILAEDGKLYMVKGLRSNIDEVVSRNLFLHLLVQLLLCLMLQ